MFRTWLGNARDRLFDHAAGGLIALALLVVLLAVSVAAAYSFLDLLSVEVLKVALLFMCVLFYALHAHHPKKHEAFAWRARWISERFGASVEGEGDYFITTMYGTVFSDGPCVRFASRPKELEIHHPGHKARCWGNFAPRGFLGADRDVPEREELGLPESSLSTTAQADTRIPSKSC
jgi:hypothetical protein